MSEEFPKKIEVCSNCGISSGLYKVFSSDGKWHKHCFHCGTESELKDYHSEIPNIHELENKQK